MARAAASSGTNWTKVMWILAVVVLAAAIAFPTVIVFGIGMLPTIVALMLDRSDERYGAFCVGGMNLCGVFPYIVSMWVDTHTVPAATAIITDIFILLIMYGAAGFGWMMFIAIPPVVASFLTVLAETRVKTLRSLQKEIIEEWGPEVSVAIDDDDDMGGVAPPPPPS